jgi:hypothetical protein
MTTRSLTTGTIGGLLLVLTMFYPAIGLIAPLLMPGWTQPIGNDLLHGFLLMLSAGVGVPVLVGIGAAAAWRNQADQPRQAAAAGLTAGAAALIVFFYGILSPLTALAGYGAVNAYRPGRGGPPAPEIIAQYGEAILVWPSYVLLLAAALFIPLAILTALWMSRRLSPPTARPSLLAWLAAGQHPRRWLPAEPKAVPAALLVGGGLGFIYSLVNFGSGYVLLAERAPNLLALFRENLSGPLQAIDPFSNWLLPWLSPLIVLGAVGMGGLVIAQIKNPPNRFAARIGAVVLAGIAFVAITQLGALRGVYFTAGLEIFFLPPMQADLMAMDADVRTIAYFLGELFSLLRDPAVTTPVVFLTSWVVIMWFTGFWIIIGLLQGGFYALIMPLIWPAPADKAARLHRHLRRHPEEMFPAVAHFFAHNGNAEEMLPHLTAVAYAKAPLIAQFAAAWHTLATSQEQAERITAARYLSRLLEEEACRDWRWAADFREAYVALTQILTARSLEDLLQIESPGQHTASLPPMMTEIIQQLNRILGELYKVERVDDLPAKLIFMENSLEAIDQAQRYMADAQRQMGQACSPAPEQPALAAALDYWQTLVLQAIRHLKGRAQVVCQLKSGDTPFSPQLPLVWELGNQGLNVAQQVRLRLLPSPDFQLVNGDERLVDILPPGDRRELSLLIMPAPETRRLRVEWEIIYDDAVDAERRLEFAEAIQFTAPDKPFKRVFPIPYVTGTPLKTNQVFVGREDVFAFIRENLLGAHQNNAIILHGQRRTGKTSALYRLGATLADTHYAVLVDMQGKPARGEADFFYSLADEIVFTLEEHGIRAEMPERADFADAPEFFFQSRFLRGLYPKLGAKNLLLLFDEFEELQRRVEDGRLQPEIFQFLRNLVQHEKRLDFIFSGTHRLEQLSADYWSALFNIAVYQPISFLSAAEMRRLILEPVAAYNVEYDPLAINRIVGVTAGHPYFTQLLLHEMMVYHNETERNYLTVSDVNQVLSRITQRGEAHFKYIWAESTPAERQVLLALTDLLSATAAAPETRLREWLRERGYADEADWAAALASLTGRDILARGDGRNPRYRFAVDLIRLWIEQARPMV